TGASDEKVRWIYRILFQRLPTQNEINFAHNFLTQVQGSTAPEVSNASGAVTASVVSSSSASKTAQKANAAAAAGAGKKGNAGKFGAIQNEGTLVDRRQQSAWEAYAQALLFTNEIAYVN